MNSNNVESIFRNLRPDWDSGYDYPRRSGNINWQTNNLAIWWGCELAERLAASGSVSRAVAFWIWALDCYHWRAEGAPTEEDYRRHLEGDQRIEVRLWRAAWCMKTHGVDWVYDHLVICRVGCDGWGLALREDGDDHTSAWAVALSEDQIKLVIDGFCRNLEPEDVLWPRPRRRRSKYIALMAAAQTIANHETAKR